MSLRYLLDTNILSAPISRTPNSRIVARLERHQHECATGAPVWQELIYGCRRLPRGKRRAAIEEYLQEVILASFTILPYDEVAAAWHGRERSRLESAGRPAPYVDGEIAAIAHANGLVLATLNPRDFKRFKELVVEDWSVSTAE